MVLTVSFVLSPVTGLFCHRRLADFWCISTRLGGCISAKLDASVGASGPHDFAVREKHLSSARLAIAHGKTRPAIKSVPNAAASTASHPASVTIAKRPSVGQDGGDVELIWVSRERKYFCEQDWTTQITLIRFSKSHWSRNRVTHLLMLGE